MVKEAMSKVVYVSKSRLERRQGPVRVAHLPGESQPVIYSVHGAIAEHYKVDPAKIGESHAATIDYVISATAGCGAQSPSPAPYPLIQQDQKVSGMCPV